MENEINRIILKDDAQQLTEARIEAKINKQVINTSEG